MHRGKASLDHIRSDRSRRPCGLGLGVGGNGEGSVTEGAWAMLTTEPGPDVSPYHDRQIVVRPPPAGLDWLKLIRPAVEMMKPSPGGSLEVVKVFP